MIAWLVALALIAQESWPPLQRGALILAGGEAALADADLGRFGEPQRMSACPPSSDPCAAKDGVVALRAKSLDGDARENVERVGRARAILFEDGRASDWIESLYPNRRASASLEALWRTHRTGGAWIAVGRAASVLSAAALVVPEEFERPLRNPRLQDPERPHYRYGLQLCPWGAFSTEASGERALERSLRVAHELSLDLVVHLEPDALLEIDPREMTGLARGGGAAWIVDLRSARRSKDWLLNARLSLLHAGDVWRESQGLAELLGARVLVAAEAAAATKAVERALDPRALADALRGFASDRAPRAIVLDGRDARVTLAVDADARVAHARTSGAASFARIAVDVEWRTPIL